MDKIASSIISHKIKKVDEISKIIGDLPREKKVIMCHGTFDVVHPGHIRHLLFAKSKGDILIASLTSDEFINKSTFRPYVPEDLRALNLAALEVVDFVLIDKMPTPIKNLNILKPDFFAKGYEYINEGVHIKTEEEIKALDTYGGEIIFTPGDVVYSSSKLIEMAPPNIATEKLMTLMSAEDISFADLFNTLKKLKSLKVHVIGDTIVDTHTQCNMIGGMTKTPTISVAIESIKKYVGGAGIVAKHLKSTGAEVSFSTVLGEDQLREFVVDDLERNKIRGNFSYDDTRPTTEKNAIITQGYRLLKIDTVDNRPINSKTIAKIKKEISESKADVFVFSDFRHGIFNKETIPHLIDAIPEGRFKVADSQVASRWGNILEFQNFDLITPNEREVRFAIGDQDSVVRPLAKKIHKMSGCKCLILKLGDRGIITYRSHTSSDFRSFFTIDSFVDNVVDPVGAGDALLAYASLSLKLTNNEVIASILGSLAAAVECEQDGNIPVSLDLIENKLKGIEAMVSFKNNKS